MEPQISEEDLDYDAADLFGKKKKKKKKPKNPLPEPCSHWFPGHRAFQAPEVNNLANYINTLPNLVGFVDLRSYGQMLSTPYSFSCKRIPKDAEDQMEAAMGATQALRMVHGTPFTVCRLHYHRSNHS